MVGLGTGHFQFSSNLILYTSHLIFIITAQIVPYVLDNVIRVLDTLFQ